MQQLLCAQERTKYILSCSQKQTIELKHQNQIRKSEPKSFSTCPPKHARQPDMTQDTATEIDSCCSLFIAHGVHVQ